MALPTFAQNLKDVMRVLLIGQNGATPASVKAMLIKEKFVCDTADLSLDGLEIGSLDYDVVLLDLSTRNANGYDVLRRLRSNAHVRTPVLILLGLAELDHRIKGLGFCDGDVLRNLFDHADNRTHSGNRPPLQERL